MTREGARSAASSARRSASSTADFNGDGWIDIYVANDGEENLLWMNQRDGTFKDTALAAGAAVTAEGKAEASMGVDAGDFDNDGDEDLFMTELTGEGSNLYVNDGAGSFHDAERARRASGRASLPYTGFGTAWFDFDNDGWLDILAVNGTIIIAEAISARGPFPVRPAEAAVPQPGQRPLRGRRRARRAPCSRLSEVGRGAAFGDIDNDGDIDVLVGNDAGPVRLLINNIGNRQHWVGLRLVGRQPARVTCSGARVGRRDGRRSTTLAPCPIRRQLCVGQRSARARRSRDVRRTSDRAGAMAGRHTEEWADVAIDRWTTLTQGSGR